MSEPNHNAIRLGTEPVGRLLLQYAIPAIIAMTAVSLYNMVDSIFIGQGVGALAISGLAVTFPFMNLSAAFGAAIGVGGSTLISVKLGQHDYHTAQKILGNIVTLNVILGLVFGAVSLLFLDPILYFFGASEQTIGYARDYMVIILIGNVVTHLYLGLNAALRAAGHPQKSMYCTIATVLINAVLDPLFIWGFGWGIQGAAIATILAQCLVLVGQLYDMSRPKELLHLQHGIYGLQKKLVSNIIAIGASPFLMNLCSCLVVIIINQSLGHYSGDLAIGAYGIANRVAFFFFMIVIGVNQGMQPIAGYSYGAQQMDRVMLVLRYAIYAATAIMFAGFAIGEALPWYCARAFTSNEELLDISVYAMRVNMVAFPLIGFQAVTTNFFQSIGYARISIFLSLTRQLLFLIPLLLVLPLFIGVNGVWWSLPCSDVLSFLVTGIYLLWFMRHRLSETKKTKLRKMRNAIFSLLPRWQTPRLFNRFVR